MKSLSLTLCLFVLVVYPFNLHTPRAPRRTAAQQPAPDVPQELTPAELARQQEIFAPAKRLLERRGVPFRAEELLDPDWRARLEPVFAQMPEMQTERRLGKELQGVQLADTLYMPEKVELTADTVIIARHVVHEGKDVLIKGNHNIYFYPIEDWCALGTTLAAAKGQQCLAALPPGYDPTVYGPAAGTARLVADVSFTIDTRGPGYREWLERQNRSKVAPKSGFLKTSLQGTTIDKTGGPGSQGSTGLIGEPGANGAPDPSFKGEDGDCSGAGVDGKRGYTGINGGTGGQGGEGGRGTNGANAGDIMFSIPYAYGSYTFLADGGQGGKGGTGGQGGYGGSGGRGGNGGNGASCSCPPGNGGDGGLGGRGGKSGKGGRGGQGGNGGNGGLITITVPKNFGGSIVNSKWGGSGGHGGEQGRYGFPGANGPGGERGLGGTNTSCSPTRGEDGQPGFEQMNLGYGDLGETGTEGNRGADGSYVPIEGPCKPDYCAPDQLWYSQACECRAKGGSPILIDVAGDGFNLTEAAGGVSFDLMSAGTPQQWAWTAANSDDAFLVLDRNGNGRVDEGAELFGNFTPQPAAPDPNGFRALAVFDQAAQGGNGDGVIDNRDAVFTALRLWQDINRNGFSEPGELHPLPELGVAALALDYKESRRHDAHGNVFRYRAKVYGAEHKDLGRWAYDVFFAR